MSEKYKHFKNKRTDKIYATRQFLEAEESILNPLPRKLRIISGVADIHDFLEFANVQGEVLLRRTPAEREEIKAVIVEDERKILTLIVQRFMVKSGNIKEFSISFDREMTGKLLKILSIVFFGKMENTGKIHYRDFEISEEELISVLLNGSGKSEHVVEKYLVNNVTDRDIVSIGFRKEQLKIFEEMLKQDLSEKNWQTFFEMNPWIFGYGLNYVFTTGLDEERLQRTVSGYSFLGSSKIPDALLKTRGAISSLCLVEVKTPNTHLLEGRPYRTESWPVSSELRGSIAQSQRTSMRLMQEVLGQVKLKDKIGNPFSQKIYSYVPKSYVIIGKLDEFTVGTEINEEKYSSFEMFRKNINNPEIITFDELYERAKHIVLHNEEVVVEKEFDDRFETEEEPYDDDIWDDDIPF